MCILNVLSPLAPLFPRILTYSHVTKTRRHGRPPPRLAAVTGPHAVLPFHHHGLAHGFRYVPSMLSTRCTAKLIFFFLFLSIT